MDSKAKRLLAHHVINIYQVQMRQLEQSTMLVTATPGQTVGRGMLLPTIIVEQRAPLSRLKTIPSDVKTGIMNFANPLVPGGDFQSGIDASEAALCRNTFLYPELKQMRRKYYYYNIQHLNDYYFVDRLLYSQKIKVLGDDESLKFLDHFRYIDVVSVAAPNVRAMFCNGIKPDKQLLYRHIYRRILWTLRLFKNHQVRVVILGDFGCQRSGNDPALVAQAFSQALKRQEFRGAFTTVYFDINQNARAYHIFKETLPATSPQQTIKSSTAVLQ
ncbi:TIGR02452 family protein [Ligilactobacillus saerimneri]|uniref:Microbial-type PARG catalytic domain-containing protein n=1 Tax=Ligilactobacillus saerimneri 30a TaxID=1227363 RepID=M5J4B1_9LACO|nr:TIGR02452 family protein [Ligilactobacillus saerimneri]EKW98371.1 hypothetical protein D271_07474 [Ligilactobacillus saerimneri 30a]MBU5310348.1 TIGR02452 family protein [Ligilactobacillus saerimneri]MCZ0892345.1 TIGR02452 family protein [Ligilactobacillus saerimneri]